MNKFTCSTHSNQEIINYYEDLRNLVLNKPACLINGNLGYSILLFRGMAAWIKACLPLELIYSDRLAPSRVGSTENNTENQPTMLPDTTQEEVTDLLTNIILSHHLQQPRSFYA